MLSSALEEGAKGRGQNGKKLYQTNNDDVSGPGLALDPSLDAVQLRAIQTGIGRLQEEAAYSDYVSACLMHSLA